MIHNYKKIVSSDFLRSSITLLLGTIIAQIIPFVMQLFLRRLYTPDQFGAFSIYLSSLSVLAIIATFRLEVAIMLPSDDIEADNLLVSNFLVSFLFCLLTAIVLIFLKEPFARLLNLKGKYIYFLNLLPLGVFFYSTYQAINYWLLRHKAFKSSSVNKISRRVAEALTQMGFGLFKMPVGLAIADIIGNAFTNLSGFFQLFRQGFTFENINRNGMINSLKQYLHFPKYSLFPAVLDTVTLALPIFFINRIYSSTYTGYVDLTQLALVAPLSLISTTISQVLYQKISEKKCLQQAITGNMLSLSSILGSIALISFIIIQLWSEKMFVFFFGDKWVMSGEIAKILIISYSVRFVVSPLSVIFTALEKLKVQAIWQVFYFTLIGSLILFPLMDFKVFLKLFVALELISYVFYYYLIIRISREYDSKLILTT